MADSDQSTITSADDAKLLLRLEEMIKSNRKIIETSREELKEQRQMLKDTFENDPVYLEHNEEVKKATKVRSATKTEILKKADVATLNEKVKSLQSQLRESTEALSDYLREYQRVSGLTTIEVENGEVLEIVYVAKLRPVDKVRR